MEQALDKLNDPNFGAFVTFVLIILIVFLLIMHVVTTIIRRRRGTATMSRRSKQKKWNFFQSRLADRFTTMIEDMVHSGEMARDEADWHYKQIGRSTGIKDLVPRKFRGPTPAKPLHPNKAARIKAEIEKRVSPAGLEKIALKRAQGGYEKKPKKGSILLARLSAKA